MPRPPPRLLRKRFGFGGVGNRKLGTLYIPVIIRVIKFKRVVWAGCLTRMGRREMRTGFKRASLKGGDQWENVAINGRIILKWFFSMLVYIGLFHLAEYKQVTTCKHGNEPDDMVKTLGTSF